jgi:uncharacterized protein (DUF2249 family)
MDSQAAHLPLAVRVIDPSRIVLVDVREDLRSGREPFGRIMAARAEVPDGGALVLRAIFEPVPLFRVMEKQGFMAYGERLAADDWRVWFHPPLVELDVREMEPPEPLAHTLAALETLPANGTLLQVNLRVPQFLLPKLGERGFTYEVRELGPDLVHLLVRRAATT